MRFGPLALLTLLSLGATLAVGQVPFATTQSQPSGAPTAPSPNTGGPPLDLLSLSHAGAGQEEHPVSESESHFETEPEHPRPQQFWGSADYLLWWIKNSSFPVLLTTGSVNDSRPGALGMPGTGILFGGTPIDNKDRSGSRIGLGYWLDEGRQWGVEVGGFYLSDRSVGTFASSPGYLGSQILARPFFNATTNQEDSSLVTFPGVAAGNVNIGFSSELFGAESNGLWNLTRSEILTLDALAGFRYLALREDLNITEVSQIQLADPAEFQALKYVTNPSLVPGKETIVTDRFGTSNAFYGGQMGLRAALTRERWTAEVTTKVAIGVTTETVNIGGSTSIQAPNQPAMNYGNGLLALGSNSGRYERDRFAVAPEVDLKVGFQLLPFLRLSVGYSFMYWSAVVRPADQIDRVLSTTQVPTSTQFAGNSGGGLRPTFPFQGTDFFAHGLKVGLEFRY